MKASQVTAKEMGAKLYPFASRDAAVLSLFKLHALYKKANDDFCRGEAKRWKRKVSDAVLVRVAIDDCKHGGVMLVFEFNWRGLM